MGVIMAATYAKEKRNRIKGLSFFQSLNFCTQRDSQPALGRGGRDRADEIGAPVRIKLRTRMLLK
jgi:hypothetical protein